MEVTLDWNVIATGLAAPVAVLIVKTLLDFSLAHYFVQWFSWIPTRGLFRHKYPNLKGQWEQIWGAANSEDFKEEIDRHSYTEIKQFGSFCYAEIKSKGVTYAVFGQIRNSYLFGEWYDKDDKYAYYGAFQLRIVDSNLLEGKFVGHSKKTCEVKQDSWIWNKANS